MRLRQWLVVWCLGATALASADEPEWQQPVFEAPPAPAPAVAPAPVAPEQVIAPRPPPQRWQYPHLFLALTGLFGHSYYLGVRAGAGVVLGHPTANPDYREGASGLQWTLGAEALAGKASISLCGSTPLCGARYGGGLLLRGAWAVGHIDEVGLVRPVHTLFVQLVPYLASASIASEPLAPGATWLEGGLRLDVGGITAFRWPPAGARYVPGGLLVALQLEWLAARRADTGAFRGGLSLGLAL